MERAGERAPACAHRSLRAAPRRRRGACARRAGGAGPVSRIRGGGGGDGGAWVACACRRLSLSLPAAADGRRGGVPLSLVLARRPPTGECVIISIDNNDDNHDEAQRSMRVPRGMCVWGGVGTAAAQHPPAGRDGKVAGVRPQASAPRRPRIPEASSDSDHRQSHGNGASGSGRS